MVKKNFYKLVSLCIVLSIFLTLFTVFPTAEGNLIDREDGVKVIYNRGYEDGWNYSNGMNLDTKYDLGVNLTYVKQSASRYNYFMRISPMSSVGGYLCIPVAESPDSGKLFFELDFKANAGNNIGGAVMVAGNGTGTDRMLTHVVSINNGTLYLLGQSVGDVPTEFVTLAFTFDFDYANTLGARKDEYKVTVSYGGAAYSEVYTAKGGFGISGIYIGAEESLYERDREGDEYFVDNVKLYYGTDERVELESNNFGSAVDTTIPSDFAVLGASGMGAAYLSGQPRLNRTPATEEQLTVHYNRYFSEGWSWENGTTENQIRENDFSIQTDYAYQINKGDAGFLNYYWCFAQKNDQNGFMRYRTGAYVPREGKTYLEFDIKCSAGATITNMLEIITPGPSPLVFYALSLENGNLYVFGNNVGQLGEEWCHIAIEMDFDYLAIDDPNTEENEATDPYVIKYTAYVGSTGIKVESIKSINEDGTTYKGLQEIRVGRQGSLKSDRSNIGDWYGFDNVQIYTSSVGFTTLPDDNYGSMVNSTATKDFMINSGIQAPNVSQIVEMGLVMKVKSNNALLFGEKVRLFTDKDGNYYGGPYKENGKVMIPLDTILSYANIAHEYGSDGLVCDMFVGDVYKSLVVGRTTIQAGGEVVKLAVAPEIKTFGDDRLVYIAIDDVEKLFDGIYVTYDETGLIFIAPYKDFISRDTDEAYMQDVAERFLYETFDLEPETVYELAKKNTNNFQHPYLLVDQERFDFLHNIYYSSPEDELFDEELIWYMDTQIDYADTYLKKYAVLDEFGNYLGIKEGQWVYDSQGLASWVTNLESGNHSVTIMPYPETGGYDPAGGRLNVLSDGETCLVAALEPCALAYQITKDEKYLKFAYDWTWSLCQWEHWGPGHFLNCANTSRPLALSYDWLYNDYVRVFGQDAVDYIARRIYENGVYEGWLTLNGIQPEHVRPQGDASKYWNHIGNWNPCGTLGMLIASLAVMDYNEFVEKGSFVITKSLYYYGERGMTYISFDGGYRESAGYWGAVKFMHFINKILIDACGTDFGLADCPGLDTTDYFGCHLESNDYVSWNYHDDWIISMPSQWYYLTAQMYDNPEYAAIRYLGLHNDNKPKEVSRYDVLFYDRSFSQSGSVNLTLDYAMPSIGAVVSRASWEPGALYVGIMGGVNNVAHGQYDSGNWIYENNGMRWFVDLGADDYNLAGGGLSMGYYKYSPEGNNTIAITSSDAMPHGQIADKGGVITSYITNEFGTATIIDQSPVFGGQSYATYARRGMLLTNDRKTVVIQDEINLVFAQDLIWSAHYDVRTVPKVELSADGRTVIMTSKPDKNGDTHTLRVSLLTANRGLKFEIWDTSTYMLSSTPAPDYSPSINGIKENDRSNYKKLVVTGTGMLKFEMAIVLEIIDPDDPVELGYKQGWNGNPVALPPMSSWVPTPDMRENDNALQDDGNLRGNPSISSIILNSSALSDYISEGTHLGTMREDFFRMLTDVEYTLLKFGRDQTAEEIVSAIAQYDKAKEKYDKYQQKAMKDNEGLQNIAVGLIGLQASSN